MRTTSIVIHLDSLGSNAEMPADWLDPTFGIVMERFLDVARRFDFPLSIYVIGQDLCNPLHAASVGNVARLGHEIGSHSWSHHLDLGQLPRPQIEQEVRKAHEAILKATGKSPRGFVSPAWSSSPLLYEVLREHGYLYDLSAFRSWLIAPLYAFWLLIHRRHPGKLMKVLRRGRGLGSDICWPRTPFPFGDQAKGEPLRVVPMPRTSLGIACWHSLGFVLGWDRYYSMVEDAMDHCKHFYYVLHAADLLAPEDADLSVGRVPVPRGGVAIDDKLQAVERVLRMMEKRRFRIVTMEEHVGHFMDFEAKPGTPVMA